MPNLTKRLAALTIAGGFVLAGCDSVEPAGADLATSDEAVAASATSDDSRALAIDYDADNQNYYAVIVSASGELDTYYGTDESWTKLQENRDTGWYDAGSFVDFAIGGSDAPDFGVMIGQGSGAGNSDAGCTSSSAREFSDKAFFGNQAPKQVGDLETCLSIDYDADNGNYYVVGTTASGELDTYYGTDESWTKLQENRDTGWYDAGSFVDFAIGGSDAPDFGVMIGQGSGAGNSDAGCTSSSAREFSDKAFFGNQAPKQVGDLETCLSIDYDADNGNYYVVGTTASGELDTYYGTDESWTKLQENRDTGWYDAGSFVDFAIGGSDAPDFGVMIGQGSGAGNSDSGATSSSAREFSDKAFFGNQAPKSID